jgi:hypothetical protein
MQKTFSGMMQRPTGNPFPVGMLWEVDGLDLRMAATLAHQERRWKTVISRP